MYKISKILGVHICYFVDGISSSSLLEDAIDMEFFKMYKSLSWDKKEKLHKLGSILDD